MKFFQSISFALGLAGLAHAHMEMTFPAPFKSTANPYADGDIDYSMTSPLDADGSNFPCKGYQTLFGTAKGKPTATFKAGSTYNMTITGGANHDGGSCQASLSFDKGKTWRVIHSYIGNCPVAGTSNLDFKVPTNTPNGEAMFAWTWFNKVGNREMYMNCAAITVTGGSSSGALTDRPTIYTANIGTGCETTETKSVNFPFPGPADDVTIDKSDTLYTPTCGGGSAGSGSSDDSGSSSAPASSVVASTAAPVESQPATSAAATSAPGGVFITVSNTPAGTSAASAPVSDAPASSAPAATFSTLITVTKSAGSDNSVPATPSSTTSTAQATPTSGSGSGESFTAGTACDNEGEWNCVGTTQFQRCASGQWSVLMAVAAGTECESGKTSALSISASGKRRRVFRRVF